MTLTDKKDSPLAGKVELALRTGDPKEVGPLGLTSTTATTAMVVIGDVLAVLLMKMTGYRAEDYALLVLHM